LKPDKDPPIKTAKLGKFNRQYALQIRADSRDVILYTNDEERFDAFYSSLYQATAQNGDAPLPSQESQELTVPTSSSLPVFGGFGSPDRRYEPVKHASVIKSNLFEAGEQGKRPDHTRVRVRVRVGDRVEVRERCI